MPRRRPAPARDVPLVGGSLAVDFVNTTGARGEQGERERLRTYADLLTWSRRVGLLDSGEKRRLGLLASRGPASARRVLSRVRKIRETLYRVLRAVAEAAPPPGDDLALLDRLLGLERRGYRLVPVDHPDRPGFELRREVDEKLDGMIWPILASAAELLCSPRLTRLKPCGECDWLFVDDSKNYSRLWCKKDCGDRVRARRHYARRK